MVKTITKLVLGSSVAAMFAISAHAASPMKKIDLNGDGVVDRTEFMSKANKRFAKIDADSNGLITKDERKTFRADKRAMRADRRFDRLDANGDGALTRDEVAAKQEKRQARRAKMIERRLAKFDTNGDGQLSDDERAAAKAQREERRANHVRYKPDTNGDGMISVAEHTAATNVKFDRLDKNGDGVLSKQELRKKRKHKRRKNRGGNK